MQDDVHSVQSNGRFQRHRQNRSPDDEQRRTEELGPYREAPRPRGFDEHEVIGEQAREEYRPVDEEGRCDEPDGGEKTSARFFGTFFYRVR